MAAKITKSYIRSHGLTTEQLAAIELLVTGQTDQEVGGAVGVARETVTRWRLYDPHFQAKLNQRRRDVFSAGADRLRALVPVAVETLEEELHNANNPGRGQLALSVLKAIGMAAGDIGPTDAQAIIDRATIARSNNQEGAKWGIVLPHERDELLAWIIHELAR